MGVASGCDYESMGVAMNLWVWLVGVIRSQASGWNLWVCLSGGGCGYNV